MIIPLVTVLVALSGEPVPEPREYRPPYEEASKWALETGVMTGDPDGQLHLDRGINRAEVVTILSRFRKEEAAARPCSGRWTDVPRDAWYTSSLCAMAIRGVAKGYPDGTFRASNNVAFTEAAKWIMSEVSTLPPAPSFPWYQGPVQDLRDVNAIPDSIERLDQRLTRGEFLEILWRVSEGVTDRSPKWGTFPIPSDKGLADGSASFEMRPDGPYYGVEKLKGADKATFATMDGDDFARDQNQCYYRWVPIIGCEPSGLRHVQLGSLYATDGKHVFYGNLYVNGANAATARVVGHLLTDDQNVFWHTEKLEGIDAATFTLVGHADRYPRYARDARQVYFLGEWLKNQARVVTGANPATFTVQGNLGVDGTRKYCGARPLQAGETCSKY